MAQIFSNNATSTLSAPINAAATTLLIQPGHGSRFPVVSGSDYSYCTLEDASGNIEIVKVVAHLANSQSMMVERAQQGTTARSWAIGDLFEMRFTAAAAATWEAAIVDLQTNGAHRTGDIYSGAHNFTGADVRVATPTQPDQPATKSFVEAQAFSAAFPSQAGNGGNDVTTDGTAVRWTPKPKRLRALAVLNFIGF